MGLGRGGGGANSVGPSILDPYGAIGHGEGGRIEERLVGLYF